MTPFGLWKPRDANTVETWKCDQPTNGLIREVLEMLAAVCRCTIVNEEEGKAGFGCWSALANIAYICSAHLHRAHTHAHCASHTHTSSLLAMDKSNWSLHPICLNKNWNMITVIFSNSTVSKARDIMGKWGKMSLGNGKVVCSTSRECRQVREHQCKELLKLHRHLCAEDAIGVLQWIYICVFV